MSNIKDPIRQEIEFLKELNEGLYTEGDNSYYEGHDNACNHILAFIDSLPEEIPPYVTGFKGEPDPPGISDLEVAADGWILSHNNGEVLYVRDAFIAGAKWMESQMPMPEDSVIFMKGVAEGRRLEGRTETMTNCRDTMATNCIRLKRGVCRFDFKPCRESCPLHKTKEEMEQHRKETRV